MSFKYWIEEAEITTKLTKMGIGCTIAINNSFTVKSMQVFNTNRIYIIMIS